MLVHRVKTRVGSRKVKNSKRHTFRPQIDVLEDRRLLAKTILVDDNHAQFPTAAFTSIQAAVDAAKSGDTIKVAPGIYPESVNVTKKLTILGASAPVTLAKNPNFASIVDPPATLGSETPGFNLLANDVVIQGFSIGDYDQDASPDNAGDGTIGIQTSPSFSGYKIVNNVIQENAFGIYLNSSASKASSVTGNTIRNNNEGVEEMFPAAGNGIYSDQGAKNITVSANKITDQSNTSIIFAGYLGTQTKLTVQANLIGDANRPLSGAAMQFINVTNSTIKANVSWNSNSHGITLEGGNSKNTIQANVIQHANWTGINLNTIYPTGPDASPLENMNNQILNNVINFAGADGGSGIRLRAGTSGTTVKGNTVTATQTLVGDSGPGFGNGITVEASSGNRIESNVLSLNRKDGIFVDGDSSGNTFKTNVASLNFEHDYHDESNGSRTAGTANTWQKNKGLRQNRPGLIN